MIMMKIQNLPIEDYCINIDIDKDEIIGVFSNKHNIVTEFLLLVAGINRSKDNCFFENENIYDSNYFFQKRIYIDCKTDIVQTLNVEKIAYAVSFAFNKSVDEKILEHHIKQLGIRGETEVTLALEYLFTPVGRTMINMALALSIDNYLIINNPTINLKKQKDIDYIKLAIKNHKGFTILGLDSFHYLKEIVNRMVIFTDFNTVHIINPIKENFYLIEDCLDILEYRLFKAYGNRVITIDIPKDILKKCNRNRIKYEKVNINEIKKLLFN